MIRGVAFLLFMLLVAGCSHQKEFVVQPVAAAGPALTTKKSGKNMKVVKADLDGDGKADVYVYYKIDPKTKQEDKVREEADLNGDGRLDLWRWFDKKGRILKDEYDLDFDGKVDERVVYKDGHPYMVELSTQYDGKFDVKEFFAMLEDPQTHQKRLQMVLLKRSSKRNGIFDEFHYFVDGRLIRIGWDRDGDGRPEVFEDNPSVGQ